MPSMGWLLRRGWAMAPIALEVGRQLDRQVRPHVRAWQLAESVDGYVGRWTDQDGSHWVVFPDRDAAPLQAFPPLADAELGRAGEQLDRGALKRHTDLPEAAVVRRVDQVRDLPRRRTRAED